MAQIVHNRSSCVSAEDEIGIARVHEDGKCFDLAQAVFPVASVCCVAAKHAGETALFAGVITADAGEHTGWNHGTVLPSKFSAIIFCRVRPDNVVNLCCKPLVRGLEVVSPMGLACK